VRLPPYTQFIRNWQSYGLSPGQVSAIADSYVKCHNGTKPLASDIGHGLYGLWFEARQIDQLWDLAIRNPDEWVPWDMRWRQPKGPTRVENWMITDGLGPHLWYGATCMWTIQGMRHEPERFARNMEWNSVNGIDFVRLVGSIPGLPGEDDSWNVHGIDPRASDHWDTVSRAMDLNWNKGMRTMVTVLGNASQFKGRNARIDYFHQWADFLNERKEQVFLVEYVNEMCSTGLDTNEGYDEVARAVETWKQWSDIPVAPSSPGGPGDGRSSKEALRYLYSFRAARSADVATCRLDKDDREERYRLCRQGWSYYNEVHELGLPSCWTNTEGRGPGFSVTQESDPERLTMDTIVGYLGKAAAGLFHCNAGVRGDSNYWEHETAEQTVQSVLGARKILPQHLPSGDCVNTGRARHPYGDSLKDQIWQGLNDNAPGCIRCYANVVDEVAVVVPLGIRYKITPRAQYPMRIKTYTYSGQLIGEKDVPAGHECSVSGNEDGVGRSFIQIITRR
jgi:hypothetical protein